VGLERGEKGFFIEDANGDKDDQTIGVAATITDGIDYTSQVEDVSHFSKMGVDLRAKGSNAGSSGDVSFDFIVSTDGVNFETLENAHRETISLNAANKVSEIFFLDVSGAEKIKLARIISTDAGFAVDEVNVHFLKKELL
jgi:hypothetical protein